MTREMYDSDNPADIPAGAAMVAGYDDGYAAAAWRSGWSRFPGAAHVHIAVSASTNSGDVLDVENGDATPQQAPGWARMRIAAGIAQPTIYCNRATRPAVEQACAVLPIRLWIATLDGTRTVAAGPKPVVAVQYVGEPGSGGHYDRSIVYDDTWPSATPAPAPAPEPTPIDYPGDAMQQRSATVQMTGGRGWYKLPSDVPAAKVISVTVYDQAPDNVGHYDAIPGFAGVATDRGELVFGNGPDGSTPDGTYGFAYWVAQ